MPLRTVSFILLIILTKVLFLLKELLITFYIYFTLKKSISKRTNKSFLAYVF
jgi:hypothetical protein